MSFSAIAGIGLVALSMFGNKTKSTKEPSKHDLVSALLNDIREGTDTWKIQNYDTNTIFATIWNEKCQCLIDTEHYRSVKTASFEITFSDDITVTSTWIRDNYTPNTRTFKDSSEGKQQYYRRMVINDIYYSIYRTFRRNKQ